MQVEESIVSFAEFSDINVIHHQTTRHDGSQRRAKWEKTLSAKPVMIKVLCCSNSILYWYEVAMRPRRAAYVGNISLVVTCPNVTIGQMQLISLVT